MFCRARAAFSAGTAEAARMGRQNLPSQPVPARSTDRLRPGSRSSGEQGARTRAPGNVSESSPATSGGELRHGDASRCRAGPARTRCIRLCRQVPDPKAGAARTGERRRDARGPEPGPGPGHGLEAGRERPPHGGGRTVCQTTCPSVYPSIRGMREGSLDDRKPARGGQGRQDGRRRHRQAGPTPGGAGRAVVEEALRPISRRGREPPARSGRRRTGPAGPVAAGSAGRPGWRLPR